MTHDTDGWTPEETELDRLYRQALEAVDAIDAIEESVRLACDHDQHEPGAPEDSDRPPVLPLTAAVAESRSGETHAVTASGAAAPGDNARATPKQVLEAALFVGGKPLTSKALARLLRDEFAPEFIDETLDELNRQYADEQRPYEIRMTEGGWLLALRPEFERVRHKVYGLGPKEVKLSQETLEVLAIVAYHQPVTADEVAALGKPSPGASLRQLLRRELVSIERGEGGPKDVRYRTTRRFLQLFDLASLDDLPQAQEIAFK